MLFGNALHHELEERQLIGRGQRIIEIPVDLKLAIGILMVVLIGAPAQLNHSRSNFSDHVETTHDGRLVIAGLFLRISAVGNLRAIGIDQKEFRLNTRHQIEIALGGFLHGFL